MTDMSTLDIRLSDALKSYVEEEVARRGYKDASEFVQALLEAERHRDIHREVEAMLLEAVNGPFSEWTNNDIRDIERAGTRLIERRRKSRKSR
jgi:Arc/MetJ-type ribon-helix-helix transcriptional regulator